jgi:hypothetical protein
MWGVLLAAKGVGASLQACVGRGVPLGVLTQGCLCGVTGGCVCVAAWLNVFALTLCVFSDYGWVVLGRAHHLEWMCAAGWPGPQICKKGAEDICYNIVTHGFKR